MQFPNNNPHPHHHNPKKGRSYLKQKQTLETAVPRTQQRTNPSTPDNQARKKKETFIDIPPMSNNHQHNIRALTWRTQLGSILLRKEVIQPHLPVRLPCYDLVPIASPTFDHSPRKTGWAVGFGCYQLS